MIHKAGEFTFYEYNVSFHFNRENVFCPWNVIGIYVTYGKVALVKYMYDFKYFEDSFEKEIELAGNLRGTRDFLDKWRKDHVDLNSVISPVIRYCSQSNRPNQILTALVSSYLGVDLPYRIAKIGVMLKSHKGFFPVVFNDNDPRQRDEARAELQKVGLL